MSWRLRLIAAVYTSSWTVTSQLHNTAIQEWSPEVRSTCLNTFNAHVYPSSNYQLLCCGLVHAKLYKLWRNSSRYERAGNSWSSEAMSYLVMGRSEPTLQKHAFSEEEEHAKVRITTSSAGYTTPQKLGFIWHGHTTDKWGPPTSGWPTVWDARLLVERYHPPLSPCKKLEYGSGHQDSKRSS